MNLAREKFAVQLNVSLNNLTIRFFILTGNKPDHILGIFLSHLMNTLTKSDDMHFRRDIYQCYHCLYGVHLAVSVLSLLY